MDFPDTQFDYHQWRHAPSHLFVPNTAYMVTGATYEKALFFDSPKKRDLLLASLIAETEAWNWSLQAWSVAANHYHFVAHAPEDAKTLPRMLKALHSKTAIALNKTDATPGRKVWYQYRDTCLTYEGSYLARLHYVHRNPEKHHLAARAEDYPWCSMGWFAGKADDKFRSAVLSARFEGIEIRDDF